MGSVSGVGVVLVPTMSAALEQLGDRTVLTWQVDALRAAGFGEVVVIADPARAEAVETTGARHLPATAQSTAQAALAARAVLAESGGVAIGPWCLPSAGLITQVATESARDATTLVVAGDTEWAPLWKQRFDAPHEHLTTMRVSGGNLIDLGRAVTNLDAEQRQFVPMIGGSAGVWSDSLGSIAGINEESQLGVRIDAMNLQQLVRHLVAWGKPIRVADHAGGWHPAASAADLELAREIVAASDTPTAAPHDWRA